MHRLPLKYFCVLVLLSVVASNAHAVQAEIAWIESEQKGNSIRFARFDGDEWMQMDEPLYVSENPLTSLALGTDNLGKKTLIWTEQRRVKTVLVSMTAYTDASNTLKWSTPGLFSDYGRENFSASILYDRNGTGWVFWAATTKNYSDIVVQRYVNGSWSEPEQVNRANEVPDNIPKASINEDGDVRVEWNSYDFDSGGYLSALPQ